MPDRSDFIESLGTLTLAHRFMRMMQRLLDAVSEVHRELGLPIKSRWISTLLLLEAEGPLTVTEVAERLGLSHPAVVQSLDDMAGVGLVRRARDASDGRRRVLSLSAKGRRWMPALHEVWDHLAEVQEQVFSEASADVLGMLEQVNTALDEKSISERVLERVRRSSYAGPPGLRAAKRVEARRKPARRTEKPRRKDR